MILPALSSPTIARLVSYNASVTTEWNDPRWRVPDSTPVEARLRLLRDLAFVGSLDPAVQVFAKRSTGLTLPSGAIAPPPLPSETELATRVLRAAQSAGYRPDPPGEWYQTVKYTMTRGGDCEDLTATLIALCMIVGLRAEPVWIDQPGSPLNHVTGRICVDGKWLWADPTVTEARLGEHPYAAFERTKSWNKIAAASELGLYQR